MEKISKIKFLIIMITFLGIILTISNINSSSFINEHDSIADGVEIRTDINIELPKLSWYNNSENPITIDELASNNWAWARTQSWCRKGDGSWVNPYVIENVTINGGGSQNGIYIQNSNNNYFIINNCTLYNSGGLYSGGIKLQNTSRGIITNNNCSDSNAGIMMDNSHNNTISGNIANNNPVGGIYLRPNCDNNTIIGNTVCNSAFGVYLWGDCDNNTISGNTADRDLVGIYIQWNCDKNKILRNSANSNNESGIKVLATSDNTIIVGNNASNNENFGIVITFDQCDNNTVMDNTVKYNGYSGIVIDSNSDDNIISGNDVSSNLEHGIYIQIGCDNNTISDNIVFKNSLNGIYLRANNNNNTVSDNLIEENNQRGLFLDNCDNNTITGNILRKNLLQGINVNGNSDNNSIYYNFFSTNTLNAVDDGTNNQWDNGTIGNYWSDYNGTDLDDDGIGDSLYNITGLAGAQDNFPIWNDGIEGNIIFIDGQATGVGAHNWTWARGRFWCHGFGTLNNPYIIEDLVINAINNNGIEIRNSNDYFIIRNCTLFNSSNGIYDAGIKLEYVSNGILINLNCSHNNGNGIILDTCQDINITSCNVNNNSLNGIFLIDCNNINILNNTNTINYNEEYGVYLIGSDNNIIAGNSINNNLIGIYLNQSNYNSIISNDLRYNVEAPYKEINCIGNIFKDNIGIPGKVKFPIDILILIIIVSVIIIVGVSSALVLRKRIVLYGKKEKEVSEDKKEKVRNYLETRMLKIDNLIEEKKYVSAIKNLNKVKAKAGKYEFLGIFNKASEKVKHCEELEWEIYKKEEAAVVPIVAKEVEIKHNIFISYSTLDSDHFQIKKIVKSLKKRPQINKVSFWERDSGESIVEFMEETFKVSNIFILFCSENAMKSKAVRDEWQAAFQMRKRDLLKIIPVYEEEEHIPRVLWHLLNVKYTKDDFDGFIENLYGELIR